MFLGIPSKIYVAYNLNLVPKSSVLSRSGHTANLVEGAGDVEVDGEVGVALPDEQAHPPLLLLLLPLHHHAHHPPLPSHSLHL